MKSLKFTLSVFLMSFSAVACGNSPLFNHQKASPLVEAGGGSGNQNNDTQKPNPASGDCQLAFPNSGLCASLTWETSIADEVENVFTLRFWDNTSSPSDGYRDVDGLVAVVLWMPSMGHGSARVTVTPQGGGVYTASGVQFIMPGDWDIRIQIKKNNQIVEQTILPIRI